MNGFPKWRIIHVNNPTGAIHRINNCKQAASDYSRARYSGWVYNKQRACLCRFGLFRPGLFQVNFLGIVVLIVLVVIRVVLVIHISEEVVDGLWENLVRDLHADLWKAGHVSLRGRIQVGGGAQAYVEGILGDLKEVEECARLRGQVVLDIVRDARVALG